MGFQLQAQAHVNDGICPQRPLNNRDYYCVLYSSIGLQSGNTQFFLVLYTSLVTGAVLDYSVANR